MSKVKERRVWYFTCDRCGVARRQSHKKKKAKESVCQKCRRHTPNPNQSTLFGFPAKIDPSMPEGVIEMRNDSSIHKSSDMEKQIGRSE